jgi:hypothetical protein
MNQKNQLWRIEIEQHLPSFAVTAQFADRLINQNQQPRFVSIMMNLTEAELYEFLATIDTGYQTRIIAVTNTSEILVMVHKYGKDVVKVQLMNGTRQHFWTELDGFAAILKSENDLKRMNANFERNESFRAWIDQTEFDDLVIRGTIAREKMKYQTEGEE